MIERAWTARCDECGDTAEPIACQYATRDSYAETLRQLGWATRIGEHPRRSQHAGWRHGLVCPACR